MTRHVNDTFAHKVSQFRVCDAFAKLRERDWITFFLTRVTKYRVSQSVDELTSRHVGDADTYVSLCACDANEELLITSL